MTELAWSWLAVPYLGCTALLLAAAAVAALVRGDRVLRLGMIGAALTAAPWALTQALAACTTDPGIATRMLRIGQGPVALVGACLLIVLLGATGQLERHRWIARLAGAVGAAFAAIAWITPWTVPGVQRVPSGMFYVRPGPLTALQVVQVVVWLSLGLLIARRSSLGRERRRITQLVMGVAACALLGMLDLLLMYGVWGVYPIAWLLASAGCVIGLHLLLRTDFIRPRGLDVGIAVELGAFVVTAALTAALALWIGTGSPLSLAAVSGTVWGIATGAAWGFARRRPARIVSERALDAFLRVVATLDDEARVAERLATLWRRAIGIDVRTTWWADDGALAAIGRDERWQIEPDLAAWLVDHSDALATVDLATMRLGPLRPRLEALAAARGAELVVPLVDRGELVGLVEAAYHRALREQERALVEESARAAARALTFVRLARAAVRERATAREVEIADALRAQAAASRDDELGRWAVAAEYRAAPRTTGAGWSATALADGRLALIATEAQAHGVAAALATAALTGAFAAATAPAATAPAATAPAATAPAATAPAATAPAATAPAATARAAAGVASLTIDDLVAALGASGDRVMHGGEPVAVFVALLDAAAQTIAWACAGHPGGFVVGPIASVDAGLPAGSAPTRRPTIAPVGAGTITPATSLSGASRGTSPLPADALLVVASSALRGGDDASWATALREGVATSGGHANAPSARSGRSPAASGRLATVLVDRALRAGEPDEDLLAVVVRAR